MTIKFLRVKVRDIAKSVVCGINSHVSSNSASIREKRKQIIVAEVAKTRDKNDIKVYLYDSESEKSNSCENRAAEAAHWPEHGENSNGHGRSSCRSIAKDRKSEDRAAGAEQEHGRNSKDRMI